MMADKIITLVQDKTGDNIYPNIKKENLPIDLYTTAQRQALNSGITSEKVKQYDTYETSKVNKADVGSVVTNLIQQKEGGILSIAGSLLTNADGKLIKGPISLDTYSKDKIDEKIKSSGGSSVGTINLSQEQYNSLTNNSSILLTVEQQNIIKKEDIGTILFKYNGTLLHKFSIGVLNLEDNTIYCLYAGVGTGIVTLTFINFEESANLVIVSIPDRLLYDVILAEENDLSFDVFGQDYHKHFLFDKINGVPVVHENAGDVKNYTIKQYFNHDVIVMFNQSPLAINIVNESNTPIDSITDLKTACGSRTQVMMTGVFQDDDLMRIVSSYNPQTNKIITSSTSGAFGTGNEILLATHTVDSNDYVLGGINDDVTLI